jgi:ornithine cyclodeaminase
LSDTVLILRAQDVQRALEDRKSVLEAVRAAYVAHEQGRTSLPESSFLRFPRDPTSRIIALPAYIDDERPSAGIKWIASFPRNLASGLERASAVLIVNSVETGRPLAIMEGSRISATRTAASAALAAYHLQPDRGVERIGLVGCGVINDEVRRWLSYVLGDHPIHIYDIDAQRAKRFADRHNHSGTPVEVASSLSALLERCNLVSFATTAVVPYLEEFNRLRAGSTILHISLRDIAPEVLLRCDNIVDDAQHVLRANTSLHLAQQRYPRSDTIRTTIGAIIDGRSAARQHPDAVAVFSPFGLGILDVAVAQIVLDAAQASGRGIVIESFLPDAD